MIYIFDLESHFSKSVEICFQKMSGPLRLSNEAGRFITLRFREVPARAE